MLKTNDTSMATPIKVVVTGLGVVAPNGIGKEAFWETLLAGRSGIGPITLFDASEHPCRIAGEVKNFDLNALVEGVNGNLKRIARQTQLALAAASLALKDARVSPDSLGQDTPFPLLLGIGCAPMDIIEEGMSRLLRHGPMRVPSYTVHSGQPHHAASHVAKHISVLTQSITISSACAAGLDSIAMAADRIRSGTASIALCGGTDAPISPMTFACLAKTGLLSLRNDTPEKASRPFDMDRDSGVISEGAGMVVLESLPHALARNATIYLEVKGHASCVDPDMDISGCGLEYTMLQSLANACMRAEAIDYISMHGPGHPVMDRIETELVKKVFGTHAYRIPASSIKGVTGNPLSAAGAMQVIACALSMRDNLIPPTANLEKPDPACDLDHVPLTPRHQRIDTALINSHGIGGGNCSMIVQRTQRS